MKKTTVISLIASIIGFLVSAYLAYVKLANKPIYCTPGLGDCASVQQSQWSTLWGIPIALLGAITYLILIGLYVFGQKTKFSKVYSEYAIFGLTFFGFIYSLYLTYLEIFVLKTMCQWCVVSALCMTVLFVMTFIDLKKQSTVRHN